MGAVDPLEKDRARYLHCAPLVPLLGRRRGKSPNDLAKVAADVIQAVANLRRGDRGKTQERIRLEATEVGVDRLDDDRKVLETALSLGSFKQADGEPELVDQLSDER